MHSTPAPAQIAILYNRLSYMVGGSQPSLSKLGNAERDSLLGLYRVFFEENIPVDFVHPEDVARNRLSEYKILFLPCPVMLSHDFADGVTRYLQAGGTVVAEARLAWNDVRGFASDVIPGADLAPVFGARENIIRPTDTVEMRTEASAALPGLPPHTVVPGAAFEEELETLKGGSVLARFADGYPAIVEETVEKGTAVLVGSFLGLAYEEQHAPAIKKLILSLAQAAGVTRDVDVSGPASSAVEVRRLIANHQQIILVFNHASNAADASIAIHLPWAAEQGRELQTNQPVAFRVAGGRAIFHKQLAAGEIWVFSVRGS